MNADHSVTWPHHMLKSSSDGSEDDIRATLEQERKAKIFASSSTFNNLNDTDYEKKVNAAVDVLVAIATRLQIEDFQEENANKHPLRRLVNHGAGNLATDHLRHETSTYSDDSADHDESEISHATAGSHSRNMDQMFLMIQGMQPKIEEMAGKQEVALKESFDALGKKIDEAANLQIAALNRIAEGQEQQTKALLGLAELFQK